MKVILAICLIALGLLELQFYVLDALQNHDPAPTNLDCIISDACGVDHGGLPQLMRSEMDMNMSVIDNTKLVQMGMEK